MAMVPDLNIAANSMIFFKFGNYKHATSFLGHFVHGETRVKSNHLFNI